MKLTQRQARIKWAEYLESGKFKQGKNQMRHAGRYCCLGVLQQCALDHGVKFTPNWGADNLVPSEVATWSGLSREDQMRFAELNDGELFDSNFKFHTIAPANFEEFALMIRHGLNGE